MTPTETVEEYYEALRRGDSLSPYFAEREDVVKFGIGERLTGYDEVVAGLREQTRTTDDWRVESRHLRTTDRESVAWFTDDVALSWTPADGTRESFDTRWSGVLERGTAEPSQGTSGEEPSRDASGDGSPRDASGERAARERDDWRFAQLHVSAPRDR